MSDFRDVLMSKKVLLIIAAAIVLVGVIFAIWFFFFRGHIGQFSTTAKGSQIGATINSDGTSQGIAATGGTVSLNLANSTTANLNLPDKSLPAGDMITMKQIQSMDGLPSGATFISGVELGPDGIWLDNAGELKVTIPTDKMNEKLIGFSFATGGKDFHYYPIEIADNTATFTLSGFSGYGILALQDEKVVPPPPSTIQRQATQYLAQIVMEGQNKTGGLNDDQKNRITNILTAWYRVSVKGNLKAAESDPDKIDAAMHEFIAWRKFAQIFGVEDKLHSFVEEGMNNLATAVKNGAEKASKSCTTDKDPTKTVKLLRYKKIIELLGLDGRSGLKEADIDTEIKNCVKFKLTITSKIVMTAGSAVDTVEASGEGTISYQDDMKLAGSAEINSVSNTQVGMDSCTPNMPEVWKIDIPEFSLATSATGPKFNLQFDMTSPDAALVWTCKFYYDIGTSTDPNPAWQFEFLHKDEVTNMGQGSGDIINFIMPNWDIVGSGGVFARKVYSRDVPVPLMSGSWHEETTFELMHTPSK